MKKAIKFGIPVLAILLLVGALLYFVPYSEKADFSLQGTVYRKEHQEDPNSEETAPCTIRFEGYLRHYLFTGTKLDGTLTVESEVRSYQLQTGDLGKVFSAQMEGAKENINWVSLTKPAGEQINAVGFHTLGFTDDRKTVYLHDHDIDGYFYDECFYLASALPETQAEEMYERLIPFFNAVRP